LLLLAQACDKITTHIFFSIRPYLRVASNQPTSNLAVRLVDCLPQ
jgi:hypothetical protein